MQKSSRIAEISTKVVGGATFLCSPCILNCLYTCMFPCVRINDDYDGDDDDYNDMFTVSQFSLTLYAVFLSKCVFTCACEQLMILFNGPFVSSAPFFCVAKIGMF